MASVMLGVIGITGCLAVISKMFGVSIPFRVTCWFCSHRQTVKFSQRNSWDCIQCGQYNGFNKDGDYNKDITGQHSDVPLAVQNQFASIEGSKHQPAAPAALCDTCNRNQEMKMYQLRQFTPSNDSTSL